MVRDKNYIFVVSMLQCKKKKNTHETCVINKVTSIKIKFKKRK